MHACELRARTASRSKGIEHFGNADIACNAVVRRQDIAAIEPVARSEVARDHDKARSDLDIEGDITIDATVGLERAEELYTRVFFEYGDDSVAQLGGVHLACEQASNVLTKILEWGRLMSYLEQSTRYIGYDTRLSPWSNWNEYSANLG